jgi:hypothetical protein
MQLQSPVEVPARSALTESRRAELVSRAAVAIRTRPPKIPGPSHESPSASRPQRRRDLDMFIAAWARGLCRLEKATRLPVGDGDWERFIALGDALNRTYAVDRTLDIIWQKLPADLREDASCWADVSRAGHRSQQVTAHR